MSKKLRKKIKEEKSEVKDANKIYFDTWFAQKILRKELKMWHRLEIETFFFTDNKLSRYEDEETYDKIFKLY